MGNLFLSDEMFGDGMCLVAVVLKNQYFCFFEEECSTCSVITKSSPTSPDVHIVKRENKQTQQGDVGGVGVCVGGLGVCVGFDCGEGVGNGGSDGVGCGVHGRGVGGCW